MAILTKGSRRKKPRAVRVTKADKQLEPSWENWEKMSGEEYHRFKQGTHSWYYHTFKADELSHNTFEWMKKNEYSKEDIKSAKAGPSHTIGTTTHIICTMLMNGMPDFNQKEDDHWQTLPGTTGNITPNSTFIKQRLSEAIEKGKAIVVEQTQIEAEKVQTYQPTIQQRLYKAAIAMTVEIDDVIEADDDLINVKDFTPLKWLQKHQCKGNHAKIIKTFYEPGFSELHELLNPPSAKEKSQMTEKQLDWRDQLDECFAVFTKEEIKSRYDAYKMIVDACNMMIDNAKLTRKPRKVKPKSSEKLVSKMKYKLQDEKTATVSIAPEEVVKAEQLWIYNTKTRKLGMYQASSLDPLKQRRDGTGLSVKGTTITGYAEKESIQKTLRKPVEQMAEFKKCGKIQRRKFFESLKVTETKLNGRINPETILLLTS